MHVYGPELIIVCQAPIGVAPETRTGRCSVWDLLPLKRNGRLASNACSKNAVAAEPVPLAGKIAVDQVDGSASRPEDGNASVPF
jgi:hypothetical protein